MGNKRTSKKGNGTLRLQRLASLGRVRKTGAVRRIRRT